MLSRFCRTGPVYTVTFFSIDGCDLDIPNAHVSKATRKSWFNKLCLDCVDKYFGSTVFQLVNQVDMLQTMHQSGFECRQDGCNAKFVLHSRRVMYGILYIIDYMSYGSVQIE